MAKFEIWINDEYVKDFEFEADGVQEETITEAIEQSGEDFETLKDEDEDLYEEILKAAAEAAGADLSKDSLRVKYSSDLLYEADQESYLDPMDYDGYPFSAWVFDGEVKSFSDDLREDVLKKALALCDMTIDDLLNSDPEEWEEIEVPLSLDDPELYDFLDLLAIEINNGKIVYESAYGLGSEPLITVLEELGYDVKCDQDPHSWKFECFDFYYVDEF